MLMIVAHHFSEHGRFAFAHGVITINRLWLQFIKIGGKIGVELFILIYTVYPDILDSTA